MLHLARVVETIREIPVLVVADGVDGFLIGLLGFSDFLLEELLVVLGLLVVKVLKEGFVRALL